MKRLCSKKESLQNEEKAYLQKCWMDGIYKSDEDCWYCEGCDFYNHPFDDIFTWSPDIEYPQIYTIDELRNIWLKQKKAKIFS